MHLLTFRKQLIVSSREEATATIATLNLHSIAMSKKGAHKSNIDIVLDKLQSNIHIQLFGFASQLEPDYIRRRGILISKCEEALRILKSKRVSLIKDNPIVRAALVIDYMSRNVSSDNSSSNNVCYMQTNIPIPALAKTVGFNKKADIKKLETMQTLIASYLDGSSIGKQRGRRNNKQTKRKYDKSVLSSSQAFGTTSSSTAASSSLSPTNLIRDLCIQLGPMIPDADFATSYAIKLFKLLSSMDGINSLQQQQQQSNTNTFESSRRISRYQLINDMKHYQEEYEAACFYLAVKKSEGESFHLSNSKKAAAAAATSNSVSKSTKKKSSKGLEDEEDVEDNAIDDNEDDDRPLNEQDIIRAANLQEGMFKQVLDYLRKILAEGTVSINTLNSALLSAPGQKGSSAKDGSVGSAAATKTLFEVQNKNDQSDMQVKINHTIDHAFEQWKYKVLEDAKTSVMKKSRQEQSDLLSLAADEVLRQAGL